MWDQIPTPWQVCLELSWQSICDGSLPIGAVIMDPEGNIVARGRNRVGVQERSVPQEITGNPLAHAEINALLAFDYFSLNPRQHILYTTVEPCPLCIGAICMAGIKQFHFAARDTWAGSADLLNTTPYLRKKQITAYGPARDNLEAIVNILQASSEVHHRHPRINDLLEVWAKDDPYCVELGVRLYESRKLRQLQARGAPVEDVIGLLVEHLST